MNWNHCDSVEVWNGQRYSEYKNIQIMIDDLGIVHIRRKVGNGSVTEDLLINCGVICKNINNK